MYHYVVFLKKNTYHIILMGDDIGLGLSSMAVCFDFCSTHAVQLSNWNPYFYWFQLITKLLVDTWLRAESMLCLVAPRGNSGTTKDFFI